MKERLLEYLRCPKCRGRLELKKFSEDTEVREGVLLCKCGMWYPVINYVPRILLADLRGNYSIFEEKHSLPSLPSAAKESEESKIQVKQSFSDKWSAQPKFGLANEKVKIFYDEWFASKIGVDGIEGMKSYFTGKNIVLDAGTGLGPKVESMCKYGVKEVIGIDISESVVHAHENTKACPGAHIIQADIMNPPFKEEIFDFIISDGVLHHTPDTKKAFLSLVPFLRRNGDIAIHVYKKMGPIREFCDDYIRNHSTKLSSEECWKFSESFTRFGKSLSDLNVDIEVPEDIPVLCIKAGKYDLQRFIYYNFFKCFWKNGFSFDENNLVNFDWYHPRDAYRHSEEEVRGWFKEAGLEEIKSSHANESGVSVRGRRA